MTVTNGYITQAEFKAATSGGILTTSSNDDIDRAINAASRSIDNWCNRRFWADSTAVVRYYTASDSSVVLVDDISTSSSLTVKTDAGGDGTYETTWTINTDFRLMPLNAAADSEPWTMLSKITTGSYAFPTGDNAVQVTAAFGWAAVPEPVKQATLILAGRYFHRRTSPFGVAGSNDMGVVRISKNDNDVTQLISAYRRIAVPGRRRVLVI